VPDERGGQDHPLVNCRSRDRRGRGSGGGVIRTRLRSGSRAWGARWTARLIPLTVDGLIWASSMVMLDSVRRGVKVPMLARWLLGLGIAATLAANIAHGLGHGPVGAAVGAWPAVALVGSYELLMMITRNAQSPEATAIVGLPDVAAVTDPLHAQAAEEFADEVAAGRKPSIRAIRVRLHVGEPRAQQVQAHLGTLSGVGEVKEPSSASQER
jgi:Protein of unknown function (DUF2637)